PGKDSGSSRASSGRSDAFQTTTATPARAASPSTTASWTFRVGSAMTRPPLRPPSRRRLDALFGLVVDEERRRRPEPALAARRAGVAPACPLERAEDPVAVEVGVRRE